MARGTAVESRDKASGKSSRKKKGKVSVKSQIRSLQRLLNKEDIGHKIRRAVEAKMQALQAVHEEHKKSEKEREMATKYHRVKFFERVKLERKRESLRKRLESATLPEAEHQAAMSQLEQCKEDLQYILHFPKGEKYVSLLRNAANPEAQAALDKERSRLRALAEQRMADEKMLTEVNEGHQRPEELEKADAKQGLAASDYQHTISRNLGRAAGAAVESTSRPPKKQKLDVNSLLPASNLEEDDFFLGSDDEVADGGTTAAPSGAQARRKDKQETKSTSQEMRDPAWKKSAGMKGSPASAIKHTKRRNIPANLPPASTARLKLAPSIEEVQKKRTRAEGGRKRRKKH